MPPQKENSKCISSFLIRYSSCVREPQLSSPPTPICFAIARLTFYGNGPEETYADRTLGAKLGIYSNFVAENMAGYVKPQECGNHTGVRWASVTHIPARAGIPLPRSLSIGARQKFGRTTLSIRNYRNSV